MEDKKVAIVMSTYNGEKYIEEQLESLFRQTYKNIEIYVRDDGSKDKTVEILKKYETQGKIHLYARENKGFIKSFFECLSYCEDADYYSFCDQDDVWYEDKVERAVNALNNMDKEKPLLYFSNYDYVNEQLEFISHSNTHKKGPLYTNAIVNYKNMGKNKIINKIARDMMVNSNIEKSCGHDWTAYMIVSAFGDIYYDKVPTLKYRRTGNNVSGGGKGFIAFQIWRIKKFFINDYFKNVKEEIIEFNNIFGDKLTPDKKKVIDMFTSPKYSFSKAMKRVFYPHMFRQKMIDEIFLRFIIFIGKL